MHHPVVPEPPYEVQVCLVVLLLVFPPHPNVVVDCCGHADSTHHDHDHCPISERKVS